MGSMDCYVCETYGNKRSDPHIRTVTPNSPSALSVTATPMAPLNHHAFVKDNTLNSKLTREVIITWQIYCVSPPRSRGRYFGFMHRPLPWPPFFINAITQEPLITFNFFSGPLDPVGHNLIRFWGWIELQTFLKLDILNFFMTVITQKLSVFDSPDFGVWLGSAWIQND